VGAQRGTVTDDATGAVSAAGWPSSTAVQTQLKSLAEQFLAGPYNALMGVLLSDLMVGRAPGLSEHEARADVAPSHAHRDAAADAEACVRACAG
jgi:hypothetical protein